MEQTVLHRKFTSRLAASLKSHLSEHQGVQLSWRLRDVLYDRIRGGFEESACLPTGNCSHHGSVEGGGWTKQDNKQGGVQVKKVVRGREYMSKITKRHSGQGDIYTHRVHINCCYLQVQQSFKFPVE